MVLQSGQGEGAEEPIDLCGVDLLFGKGHGDLVDAMTKKINAALEIVLRALSGELEPRTTVKFNALAAGQSRVKATEEVVAIGLQLALMVKTNARRIIAIADDVNIARDRDREHVEGKVVRRFDLNRFRLRGQEDGETTLFRRKLDPLVALK